MNKKKNELIKELMAATIILIVLVAIALMNIYKKENIIEKISVDEKIDENEMNLLLSMSCEELKAALSTDKNVCIYFTDVDGNIINISGKNGIGCPGLKVDGLQLCSR